MIQNNSLPGPSFFTRNAVSAKSMLLLEEQTAAIRYMYTYISIFLILPIYDSYTYMGRDIQIHTRIPTGSIHILAHKSSNLDPGEFG